MTTVHAYTTSSRTSTRRAHPQGHDRPASRPRRRHNIIPDDDRRREGDLGLVHAGAEGQARRVRPPGAGADRLGHGPHRRPCRARRRSRRDQRRLPGRRGSAPCRGTSCTPRTSSCPADIVTDPPPAPSTRRSPWSIGTQVKVVGWYDNEWGYSNRLVDLVGPRRRLALGGSRGDHRRAARRETGRAGGQAGPGPLGPQRPARRRADQRRRSDPGQRAHDLGPDRPRSQGRRDGSPRAPQGRTRSRLLAGAGRRPARRAARPGRRTCDRHRRRVRPVGCRGDGRR